MKPGSIEIQEKINNFVKMNWLGSLDYHMFSMTYKKVLEIPSVFLSRATVDATFVPWLWASVNWARERQ